MSDIQKLFEKKEALNEKIASLEKQIFILEGKYIEDTQNVGNIVMYFFFFYEFFFSFFFLSLFLSVCLSLFIGFIIVNN